MPDLKHGSGTETVPYHLQRYENEQKLVQECNDNDGFKKKNVSKLTRNRIPSEHLDKSALVTQCKAYEDYIGRLLLMIPQPDKEAQPNENFLEEDVEAKTKVAKAENSEKRKGAKRNCENHYTHFFIRTS